MPAKPIKLTRNYLTQQMSKLLGNFDIHWVRQYEVNVVLFGIKSLLMSKMTIKLKSNLYIGPVYIFIIFVTAEEYV